MSDGGYVGYAPLRPGRIHLYCRGCGRKQSNGVRHDHDPPNAVLMDVLCDECSSGCMEPSVFYRDAEGREIEP